MPALALLFAVALAVPAQAQWRMVKPPTVSENELPPQGMAPMGLTSNGSTLTTNETAATPEIRSLSRALDNDPRLIYEYVRNHIQYGPPTVGCVNGAAGCLLAGRGNDWDQAALLVSLLRTAACTTRFASADVTYSKTNLAAWLGVAVSAVPAVIGNGGRFYSHTSTTLTMQRLWVETQIGGQWYTMDPSYKQYQDVAGVDLATVMNYNRAQFTNSAMSGATATSDYVKNANETNVTASLTAYATNLAMFIQTNCPYASVEEIVGGRRLLSETLTNFATTLPGQGSVNDATKETWDNIPDADNVAIRVRHFYGTNSIPDIDRTFKGYELATERISIFYTTNSAHQPELRLDGALMATGSNTVTSNACKLTISIDHPYTCTNTYADDSYNFNLLSGSRYIVIHDLENVSPKSIASTAAQLNRALASGLSTNTEAVFAGGLQLTTLAGLQQWRLSRELLARLSGVIGYAHHFFGVMGQESGYYVDLPGIDVSVTSTNGSTANEKAWFKASALFSSALEHGILEESQSSDRKCASTVKLLQMNNANGSKTFLTDSNNWTTVRTNLQNYSASLTNYISQAVNVGYVFLLPQTASITNIQWKGVGYVQLYDAGDTWSMGMIIAGGYGGYAGDAWQFDVAYGDNTWSSVYMNVPTASTPQTFTPDPVNLQSGDLTAQRTDLVLGNAPEPMGLALVRSYNSGQSWRKDSLGYGWTHQYDITANPVSHGDSGLGQRQPADAAALIAQSFVTVDLLQGTPDVKAWISAVLATKWGMDQLLTNTVTVRLGGRSLEYVRLPDGSYVAPPGVTTALRKQSGVFVMEERFGTKYTFNTNGTINAWQDANSNKVSFSYDANANLTGVTNNSFGYSLALRYNAAGLLTNVADNAGRFVSYAYSGSNLTVVSDAAGNSWTNGYDTNRCLTWMRDGVGRLTASNTYDAVSKVQNQMNGTSNVWNFYISGWRGVEEDPQGGRTIHYFDDDGRNLGAQDALSNRTYLVYDTQGHPITNVDARGFATVFQYDNNHNLTNRIDALTNRTAYAYDAQFHLIAVTDPLGNVTRYGYDSKHHVTNTVDALSNVTVMAYFTNGLLQSSTLGGRSVSNTYDSYGNPFTVTRTDGGTVTNRYNGYGDVTNMIDALGRTNVYTYDKRRLLTSARDALGFASSNVFDASGLLTYSIDRNGNTNQTTYTATYKPETFILPNGGTNRFRYDSRDWLVSITDPLGHVTSNRFDKAGRKIAVVDALTNATAFVFDPNGNLIAQTNALGHVTHFEFDALNRLTNAWDVTDAGTRAVASVFDAASRLTAVRDADGFTTQFQYDALNRKTTVIKPDGTTERFEYNAFGDLTAFVNAEGRRTELTFDGMSRQRTITDALTNRVSCAFDLTGNLIARTNANGSVVQFQYNAVNSLQKTIYPGGVTNSYFYDKNRLLTNAVDGLGASLFAYDRMNWQTQSVSIVGSVTSTVAYVYDLKGNRTRVVYPGGLTATNTFDVADRLVAVTDLGGRGATYTYDALHSPTGTIYPNGVSGSFVWDSAARLTRVTYSTNSTAFLDRAYTLSAAGDRTREDVNAGIPPTLSPAVQRLAQDPADRLTAIYQKTNPDSPAWATNTPTWDANGNMLADGAGLTLSFGAGNRVTNLQSAVVGNRTVFYNACGAAVKRVVNGTNIVDVFDGPRLLMSRTTNGTALIYYLWGNGLIAQIATNGVALYCHADGQGNVLALTGTGGQLTDQWFYSPYGAVLNRTGTTDTPFQWLGGYGVRSEGSGIYRTRYRVYHAGLMRFTSRDPIWLAGGGNPFAYANGNPLLLIDPTGLCPESRYIDRSETIAGTRAIFDDSSWYIRVFGNLTLDAMQRGVDSAYVGEQSQLTPNTAFILGSIQGIGEVTAGTALANAGAAVGSQLLAEVPSLIPVATASGPTVSHLDTLERTGALLEMIRTGQGQQASQIIQEMGNSSAGREELFRIHQQVSQILPHASTTEAVNVMKTLQDLTGTFANGGH